MHFNLPESKVDFKNIRWLNNGKALKSNWEKENWD